MSYVDVGPAKVPEPGMAPWVVSYEVDDAGGVRHLGYSKEALDRLQRERAEHAPVAQHTPTPAMAYFPIRVEVAGIDPASVALPDGVTVGDVSIATGAVRLSIEREAFGPAVPDDARDLAHATLRLLSDVLAMRQGDALDVRLGIDGEWSLREATTG